MRRAIVAITIILGLAACSANAGAPVMRSVTRPAPPSPVPPSLEEALAVASIPFRTVHYDPFGPMGEHIKPEFYVFRTQAELTLFQAQSNEESSGSFPTHFDYWPAIDFSTEMGLLVMGPAFAEVAHIEVLAVEESPDELGVYAATWDCYPPAPSASTVPAQRRLLCSTAVSRPFILVAIQKSPKPVRFRPLILSHSMVRPPNRPWPYVLPSSTPRPETSNTWPASDGGHDGN